MTATRSLTVEITGDAGDIAAAVERITAPKAAPVFEPSPALVELHATVTRLERNIARAATFSPRLRMRLDRARQTANARWLAEVRAFEQANPSTPAEAKGEPS